MSRTRSSVLVVASEDSPNLRACLQRVRSQARSLASEVVLVLNQAPWETPPGSAKALAELADLVEYEPRVGKSHGLNTGLELCRGEVIAFSDDDAIPQPGWLEGITRPLLAPDRPLELVGCGGPVRPRFVSGAPRWYRAVLARRGTHFVGPKHDMGREPVDYAPPDADRMESPLGVNCAYRREVFDRYQFDPDLGPNRATGLRGGEDFAVGMRLLQDGYRLQYRPDALIDHPVRPDRTTIGYVRGSYLANAVEEIRLRQLLGQRLPSEEELRIQEARLHAKLAKLRERRLWRRAVRRWRSILDPARPVRHQLKLAKVEGMLLEVRRLEIRVASRLPGASRAV